MKKLCACLLTLALLLGTAACGAPQQTPAAPTDGPEDYTVTVHTQGGMPLSGIGVYVYADDTLSELVDFGQTDETGTAVLPLPRQDGYAVTLDSVPRGYAVEAAYAFSGNAASITLTSSLRTDERVSALSLGVGDVMADFTVDTADGTSVTLSELLKEKDMVLLNFFFTTCGPCATEFPFLQQTWEAYADSVGVIALDPLEDSSTVATYQQSMGLTFPMAACPASWSQSFGITGYPTSVVIDRYGVICLVEVGALTSAQPFVTIFDRFAGDGYTQALYGSLSEMVTVAKPTCTMASSEEIAAVLGTQALDITYRPETKEGDAEYAWPFIETEKNGDVCLKASNQTIDGSFAILYADVPLQKGQALAIDYLSSSESGCDILYIVVDGQDVCRISGFDTEEAWQTCYPWVALEDGVHKVAFCYLKDSSDSHADDTVYLKNLRIVGETDIDVPTYIPMQAAVSENGFDYTYADIVLSEDDGYYHVGTADGPLLLAELMNYSQFSEEKTVWQLVNDSSLMLGGQSFYDAMVHHFSYASNSAIGGFTPVNEELRGFLEIVDEQFGFDQADPNEWLKCCTYYAAYGTDTQLENPVRGLNTFAPLQATLGVGVESNFFYYDRPIMPRGLVAAVTPARSGVYRITSHADSFNGVEGWIFTGDLDERNMTVYAADQRMEPDVLNLHMYHYMEAGVTYYIDICFWDMYEVGYIPYDIEYIAPTYDLFRLASPGYFTYDPGATGEDMYHLIAGGIDVVLGDDGIYYHDLGDGQKGSKLYCDFTGLTGIFGQPMTTVQASDADGEPAYDADGEPIMVDGIIQMGGFDFSRTENDQYIQSFLDMHGGDVEKTDAYLRELWGEEYDSYAEIYALDDVYAGRCHGGGEDYTPQIEAFLDDIITTGPAERRGCVVVTQELAELLQRLMDKFTFRDVDHSWTKLCYYYEHLGG